MMDNIELEFEEPIPSAKSKKIIDIFELSKNRFWTATKGSKIVGTIGLSPLANGNLVLKSMFVDQSQRGLGVSDLLLKT